MWQIKAAIAVAVALLIGGLVWKEHRAVRRAQIAEAKVVQERARADASEASRKIEIEDRKHADQSAKDLEAELAAIRAEPRITGVRICPRLPAASQSRTPTVPDDPTAERVEGVPTEDSTGLDVSAELDQYATNCAATAATLEALQAWELQRSH